MKKFYSILIVFFLTLAIIGCEKEERVLEIFGAPTSAVQVGATIELSTNLQGVSWSSNNEQVAFVTIQGLVMTVAEGAVTIKATLGALEASVTIQVGEEQVDLVKLSVGTNGVASQNFFTSLWDATSNTVNNDVRRLTTGYATVVYRKDTRRYELDPMVVKHFEKVDDENGDRSYVIEIHDDLQWNNGESITAKDYLFTIMLMINPVFAQIVQRELSINKQMVGNEDYGDPTKNTNGLNDHVGLALIDEYTFSMKVKASSLPTYYEYPFYFVSPLPLHHLLPSGDIVQGDQGAKFVGMTRSNLQSTIDYGMGGYRYDISVTSGPYTLIHYDKANIIIRLNKNPYYKGNYAGEIPQIEQIEMIYMPYQDLLPALLNGSIQLVLPTFFTQASNQAMDQALAGNIQVNVHYRNGFGYVAFHSDEPVGATSSAAVRQAIAILLDREWYLQAYANGNGAVPTGQFGFDQWMVKASMDEDGIVYGRDAEGNLVALNPYLFSLENAVAILEADGWIWADEEASILFDGDNPEHTLRYKQFESGYWEGQVLPLEVKWASTTSSAPAERMLPNHLIANAAAVGMRLEEQNMVFDTLYYEHMLGASGDGYLKPAQDEDGNWLLPTYHLINPETSEPFEQDKRAHHMFTAVAVQFSKARFDPYPTVSIEHWGAQGGANVQFIYDEELLDAAIRMKTAQNDEDYLYAWQQYQYRYNVLMPTFALYSASIRTFYGNRLTNFEVDSEWVWTEAVIGATITNDE